MVDFVNLYNNPDTDRTTLTANLTIAASMSSIMVESTDLLQVGINIFMSDGSEFVYATVTAINSPTDFDADKISGSADALVVDSGATVQVVGPEGTAGFSSPLTTKGDVLTYDTSEVRLGVGADGQVLTANSATSEGIEWTTPSSAGIETQEEGVQVDAAATTLNFVGAGVTATDAGSNVTTVTIPGGGGSSPLTTKGDLYTYDSADQRLPIGTDGQILSANSATSTGLEWIANTGGGGGSGGGASTLLLGLGAWWKLDEVSGDRGDSSGNGWTLTDDNTVTSQAGLIGNEAVFVAANSERLFIPTTEDAQPFREDQSFSFSTWVTFDSLAATQTFASVYDISGNQRKWQISWNISGVLSFTTSVDGAFGGGSSDTLNTSGWSAVIGTRYHVVITYDVVTNEKIIYVDGALNDSKISTHSAGLHRSTDSIVLGAQRAGTSVDFLDGKLDECAYWSRALTSDEVSELYNSGAGITLEDLASGSGGSGSGGGHSEDFGDGAATSFVITHNLGTKDVVVSCWDNTTPFDEVYPTVSHTSDNTVTLDFGATVPTSNQYRVFVTSGGGGGSGNSGLTALTANTTVNVTDFATLETEINNLSGINLNGFDYTIQCADGTYTFVNNLNYVSPVGSGNVIIKGNVADETLVDLATGAFQFVNTTGNTTSELKFEDVQFSGDGSTGVLSVTSKSVVSLNTVKFASTTTNNLIGLSSDALLLISGDIDVSGISVARFVNNDQGVLRANTTLSIDVTGATWTSQFVRAVHLAYIRLDNGLVSYTGSATGTRFQVDFNGVIQTNTGGAATTLPGNANGTTANGGQYN